MLTQDCCKVVSVQRTARKMEIRIDKWLWAVRIYKTRTQAAEACRGGHVEISGDKAKASRIVKIGDEIVIRASEMTRTVKITGLLDRRVGPKLVSTFMEDLTPPAEYEKAKERRSESGPVPIKGFGRPTKKDRRALKSFLGPDSF
jgi:ribosome-associated heat shock protein Hsp15